MGVFGCVCEFCVFTVVLLFQYIRCNDKATVSARMSLVKVKVKVSTLDIAPLRGTPPQKRSGTDHTVLPANFTVPASTS